MPTAGLSATRLWEHQVGCVHQRAMNQRSSVEKVAFRREVAAIAEAAKPSKRSRSASKALSGSLHYFVLHDGLPLSSWRSRVEPGP